MFKVRDGPIDWYFCDAAHAELWVTYRHRSATYRLCRMLPAQRRQYLQGRSMEEEISRLEGVDAHTAVGGRTDGVCDVPSGEVPLPKDA